MLHSKPNRKHRAIFTPSKRHLHLPKEALIRKYYTAISQNSVFLPPVPFPPLENRICSRSSSVSTTTTRHLFTSPLLPNTVIGMKGAIVTKDQNKREGFVRATTDLSRRTHSTQWAIDAAATLCVASHNGHNE